ncbi:breast carcinoma-amplified sequence 1 isoform X2 [Thalassophryne amazonica]|uniref:breast carcinoma-amplified sequence 1 isoform X2 n=1 Tax=Thalassophryne amazonica TaxID=390379 RepID=UPI001470EF5A|nr:breast carcinoma-amplified sequence 1 isoform X2 [Thalassophryne amazonica]
MNFFKTLVTPTKTPKKETATGDATKDQAAPASDPSAAPKAVPVPPPAPPEPPKVEIKGEPPARSTKPTPKEEPKDAAKEPESSKGISAKIRFGSLFRPKVLLGIKASKGASSSGANVPAKTATLTIEAASQAVVDIKEALLNGPEPDAEDQIENNVTLQEIAEDLLQLAVGDQMGEESPQPVVESEKPDASKTGTLEAAAKLEPPPPAQEEKKAPSKISLFSAFKSKTAEAKKQTPAPPPAAEAAQVAKTKEEPKTAAKTVEAAVDNKAASGVTKPGDDAAKVPVKQEKTNSKQFLFKLLQQKRPSTDAGVQTESMTAAPATEKAK